MSPSSFIKDKVFVPVDKVLGTVPTIKVSDLTSKPVFILESIFTFIKLPDETDNIPV